MFEAQLNTDIVEKDRATLKRLSSEFIHNDQKFLAEIDPESIVVESVAENRLSLSFVLSSEGEEYARINGVLNMDDFSNPEFTDKMVNNFSNPKAEGHNPLYQE